MALWWWSCNKLTAWSGWGKSQPKSCNSKNLLWGWCLSPIQAAHFQLRCSSGSLCLMKHYQQRVRYRPVAGGWGCIPKLQGFAFHNQIQADCRSNAASYPTDADISFPVNNTTQAYTLLVILNWWPSCLHVMPFSSYDKYWNCRGTCCLHVQRRHQIHLKC
jgi:hypothetical protein